jgi:hypothetical protein
VPLAEPDEGVGRELPGFTWEGHDVGLLDLHRGNRPADYGEHREILQDLLPTGEAGVGFDSLAVDVEHMGFHHVVAVAHIADVADDCSSRHGDHRAGVTAFHFS